MIEKETFEAQADAVERLMRAHSKELSKSDTKHLACAIRNLEHLAEVRRVVFEQIADESAPTEASEALSDQLIPSSTCQPQSS
jgi:hypothetical protein